MIQKNHFGSVGYWFNFVQWHFGCDLRTRELFSSSIAQGYVYHVWGKETQIEMLAEIPIFRKIYAPQSSGALGALILRRNTLRLRGILGRIDIKERINRL